MSTFRKYLETLDVSALRAMRYMFTKEMFEKVSLGNKIYNTESYEQKLRKEIDSNNDKVRAINDELKNRLARSKINTTVSKKRKASKTPSK